MIVEIQKFLSDQECDELIKHIDENNIRSSVSGSGSEVSTTNDSRTSFTSDFSDENETIKSIKKKISNFIEVDIKKSEPIQGQKYDVGQYFRPHHDYFQGDSFVNHCLHSGNRTHTAMIYLNDDYQGGETNFPELNFTVKPQKGKLVIWKNMVDQVFQSNTLHEGKDVLSGTKYIITSWWREREWNGLEDSRQANLLHEKRKQDTTVSYKSFTSHEDFPRFHSKGYEVIKMPEEAWSIVQEIYQSVKDRSVEEVFHGKEDYIPGQGVTSEIMDISYEWEKRDRLHKILQPIHEQFCGVSLEPSFAYGIRSYNRGAGLTFHKDRLRTHHISSIIIVDKDLACGCVNKPNADDWPLNIQSHNGAWNEVYANEGEMILYESAKCEHGRNNLFGGTYFRNLFLHYKLKDWKYNG